MSSLRVLVAEDHPVNRQYMAALLEGMGHRPFFAGNGLEAVQAIREQRFDIVLMDLHMPLLDGVGATLSIRALPDGVAATVPIIALTADAFAQTRERCLMAGMNDFLAKPVSPDRLSAMFRRLFGAGGSTEAAPCGHDRHAAERGRLPWCWTAPRSTPPCAPCRANAWPTCCRASSRKDRRWSSGCASPCATARRWTCASMPMRRAGRRSTSA